MTPDLGADDDRMPRAEFAFPGPLRDSLVAAILAGEKTSTTGLLLAYEVEGDPLPEVGDVAAVVDSLGRPVAVIRTTSVRVVPLGEVDLAHAVDEGEGHRSVAEWRTDHEAFWNSAEHRAALGGLGVCVDDDTPVVLSRFRLLRLV